MIFYGIDENKKDVTDICLKQLTRNNIITIPQDDHARAAIFGDHIPGVEKSVFIDFETIEYIYDIRHTIKINLADLTIKTFIYKSMIFYGIDENKKDVTDICLKQLVRDNIITIPHDDCARAAIFGDHVLGVEKKIFVVIENIEHMYDIRHTIKINLDDLTVETFIYKPMIFIFYGIVGNKRNVTEKCMNQFKNGDIITIPNFDHARDTIFGDHIPGVEKKISVVIEKENEYKTYTFDASHKISINVTELTIHSIDMNKLTGIHNNLQIKYGNFQDELPEQILAANYLTGTEKVLEIGGNIGRNSLVIASIVKDFVTMETESNIAKQLSENRDLNHFTFHIENSALSKRRLIQTGWDTKPSDVLEPGYNWVNTITLEELNAKYNIEFDTLILDCEGAFYYILLDMPEILKNVNLIIVENDYHDISHKHYVDAILKQHNFYVQYQEAGGFIWFYNNFYEVWKKR